MELTNADHVDQRVAAGMSVPKRQGIVGVLNGIVGTKKPDQKAQ
jgi:hypothetical protein